MLPVWQDPHVGETAHVLQTSPRAEGKTDQTLQNEMANNGLTL